MHRNLLKLSILAVTAFVAVSASADTATSCNNTAAVGRYAKTKEKKQMKSSGNSSTREGKPTQSTAK